MKQRLVDFSDPILSAALFILLKDRTTGKNIIWATEPPPELGAGFADEITLEQIKTDSTHFIAGGMRAMGGTKELWLNVTYNYGHFYYRPEVFGEGGIRSIYGKTGAESIPMLEKAISALGDDVDDSNYWNATEGNAKRVLYGLLAFAKMRPDGVWDGD